MDLILSSFCFQNSTVGLSGARFYERLPPVCFNTGKGFIPDYSSLFMADTFIIDESTYRRITHDAHFQLYSDVLSALKDSGRLKVRSFKDEISSYSGRIDSEVEKELLRVEQWYEPFRKLLNIWNEFQEKLRIEYSWFPDELKDLKVGTAQFWDFIESDEFWAFKEKLPHEREFLYDLTEILEGGMYEGLSEYTIDMMKNPALYESDPNKRNMEEVVRGYLTHLYSNIVLSQKLKAHLHDWADIKPLYDKTSNLHALGTQEHSQNENKSKEIINAVFPSFRPRNQKSLCKILDDKRIEDFRKEVHSAVMGQTEIDLKYISTLYKAISEERGDMLKGRKLIGSVSFLNSIAGLFTPIASGLSLGVPIAEKLMDSNVEQAFPWFYLMSEHIEK
ncbi:hypothetical protein [Paraglaciecola aestuariivivens]